LGNQTRKNRLTLRGGSGVWNRESGDRIKGCDGACIHAVGSLAGADGWSITNVAAFPFPDKSFRTAGFSQICASLCNPPPIFFVAAGFSTTIVNSHVHDAVSGPFVLGFDRFAPRTGSTPGDKMSGMGE